jgi:hypothetical protein
MYAPMQKRRSKAFLKSILVTAKPQEKTLWARKQRGRGPPEGAAERGGLLSTIFALFHSFPLTLFSHFVGE